MKKYQTKIAGIVIALIVLTFILPVTVLAAMDEVTNKDIQIVKMTEGDYIIYVKGVTENFKYALSEDEDMADADYINSVTDETAERNNVAVITEAEAQTCKYIAIKTNDEETVISLNFDQAFGQKEMEEVETTTRRIETEVVTDIIEKDEEVEGIKVKVTVGGLKIKDNEESTYAYFYKKLPAEGYTTLMNLAEKINAEYNEMDMYNKIEIAREFSELYNQLKDAEEYTPVENMTIMQPNDAQKDEQYVVFLKKADTDGNEIIDVKLMKSYREDEEERIPGRTETVAVKETTKLPITGDSILLFAILAVIILVAIIVFIRMRKLQEKENRK